MKAMSVDLRPFIYMLGFLAIFAGLNSLEIQHQALIPTDDDHLFLATAVGDSVRLAVVSAYENTVPGVSAWVKEEIRAKLLFYAWEANVQDPQQEELAEVVREYYMNAINQRKEWDSAKANPSGKKLSSSNGVLLSILEVKKEENGYCAAVTLAISRTSIMETLFNTIVARPELYEQLKASKSFLAAEDSIQQKKAMTKLKLEGKEYQVLDDRTVIKDHEGDYVYFRGLMTMGSAPASDSLLTLAQEQLQDNIVGNLLKKAGIFAEEAALSGQESRQRLDEYARSVAKVDFNSRIKKLVKIYEPAAGSETIYAEVALKLDRLEVHAALCDAIREDKDLYEQLLESHSFMLFELEVQALKETEVERGSSRQELGELEFIEMKKALVKDLDH